MYIALNRKLVKAEQGQLAVSEGFMFGYGIFETVKVMDFKPVFIKEHLDRLESGLKKIDISDSLDRLSIEKTAKELIEKNGLKDGALKIIAYKNKDHTDLVLSTRAAGYPERLYERGFRLDVSNVKRNPHSIIPYLKSLNYMENILERNKAVKKGFDDCLFLNTDSFIAETSISNVFFVKENKAYTPYLSVGILNGIVREKTMQILKKSGTLFEEGNYSLERLLEADEVFATNSLMGIMPVSKVSNVSFDVKRNPVTKAIRESYREVLDEEINA